MCAQGVLDVYQRLERIAGWVVWVTVAVAVVGARIVDAVVVQVVDCLAVTVGWDGIGQGGQTGILDFAFCCAGDAQQRRHGFTAAAGDAARGDGACYFFG